MTPEDLHLRRSLHRVWDVIAPASARELGHQTLTAIQVRDAVLRRIDGSAAINEPTRMTWRALTANQKDAALIDAFPDGPYMAPSEADDFEDDVLTD